MCQLVQYMVAKSVKTDNGELIFGKPEQQGHPFRIKMYPPTPETTKSVMTAAVVPHINLDKVRLSTPRSLCMAPGTVNRQERSEYKKSWL